MSFVPEDQLLIQCSRVEMGEVAITKAWQLLQQDLDWNYILEVSVRHGVAPLFYLGLKQMSRTVAFKERIPAHILEELQKLYHNNQFRNRRLYRAITDIIKVFEQAGIQAMGLKDLQLAWEVYPDIGLRPIGDLDILIHPEDYATVAACLAKLGFVPLPDQDTPFTLKYGWTHDFHRPTDNIWLDVQWNVLQGEWDIYKEGSFDSVIEAMWAGASLMAVDDSQLLVPAPEDMLFHLCLHLEGHQYCELILFCDIAELLRYYGNRLNWEYLVKLTKERKAESSIYYVLFLVQRLFDVPLPPNLLPQLQPTYFKANIFGPLFGNLTPLHLSLDEIYLASFPPEELMKKFETIVRRQMAGAIQLYKEIDELASAFMSSGGSLTIFDGAVSERMLPDLSLRPFKELLFLVLDYDLPCVRHVLVNHGFESGSAETYLKEWGFVSIDPLLAQQPTRLKLQVDIETGLNNLFGRAEVRYTTKKDTAFRILKSKLGDPKYDESCIGIQLKLVALSPEEMLVFLSAQLGKQRQSRLFGLCNLFEFFRGYTGSLDWQQVACITERLGVRQWVYEGLLLVNGVLDNEQVPPTALNSLCCPIPQPNVLEWARQGPASLVRYTAFKRAFFYLYGFLSIKGINKKSQYLVKSFVGGQKRKPVLPSLILELVPSLVAYLRRKRRTNRELVYWIESPTVFQIKS